MKYIKKNIAKNIKIVLNIAFELYRRGRYDKIIYNLSFERNERNSTIRVL